MGGIKIDPIYPVNPYVEIQKDKKQENKMETSLFEKMLRQAQQKVQCENTEKKEEKPKDISQEAYQKASLQQSFYMINRLTINRSNKKGEEKK